MKRNMTRVIVALLAVAGLLLPTVASAANNCAGSVAAYSADSSLETGLIVRLDPDDPTKVEAVDKDNSDKMFGVVADQNQVPITSAPDGMTNPTFVATDGSCQYNVLVSTENGDIKSGDYIAMSSISGVGMSAGSQVGKVFGRAVSSFNSHSVVLQTIALKGSDGSTAKSVSVGLVPAVIDIRDNPNIKSTKANLPQWLQTLGQEVGGRPDVNPIRIWISAGVAVAALVWAVIILYAGVRNAIISIGRNPMSKRSIFRALAQVIITSLLILVIGLFAVYLLLRL